MDVIRVLVVEDSVTIRKYIVEVLEADRGFEVVAEAPDGRTAIELCQRLRPDVITMDMMLPVMTGVGATEHIMAYFPTPILIVSASTNRGELFRTYDALAAGAVDVLEKPYGTESNEAWERKLVAAVRMVSRIRVITHPRAKLGRLGSGRRDESVLESAPRPEKDWRVIAIGASTGGPAAVLEVLKALPASFPLPILLLIHISEPFGQAMAGWLDSQIKLPVRFARDDELLPAPGTGVVLMAPPETHLELVGHRLRLSDGPERHSCRPSVDVLFESLARDLGSRTVACLLTGMGRDGAQGLLAIRQSGGETIAQDEATSVVFGMPAEAIRRGAALHVLPLQEIGPMLACIPRTVSGDPRGRQ